MSILPFGSRTRLVCGGNLILMENKRGSGEKLFPVFNMPHFLARVNK